MESALRVKYGEEKGGWCTKVGRAGYGVGVWKVIRKERDLMVGKIAFEVGDGSRVKFWKDKCGSVPLCDAFPTLIAVTTNKEALIKDMWSMNEGEGRCWNPLFLRPFNDLEL